MSDLKIWKIISVITYPHAALLLDNRGQIANKWQGKQDLTDWKISLADVIIRNKSNSTFLQVNLENCVIVMELPENYKLFCELAIDFFTNTLDILDVRKIKRVGLRVIRLAERKNFQTLVTNMRQRLYRLEEKEWELLGGYPVDVGFPLTLDLGENKANFNIGPMQKEQLTDFFESNEVKQRLPSTALFVDFDLYTTNPKVYEKDYKKFLSDFLKSGGKEIEDKSNKFVEYYGGFNK